MDEETLTTLIAEKNKAYKERNRLVAVLARLFPSYLKTNVPDKWPIVYITLPTGQISFHILDVEVIQFMGLDKNTPIEWDGHTYEEKWRRTMLYLLQATDATPPVDSLKVGYIYLDGSGDEVLIFFEGPKTCRGVYINAKIATTSIGFDKNGKRSNFNNSLCNLDLSSGKKWEPEE